MEIFFSEHSYSNVEDVKIRKYTSSKSGARASVSDQDKRAQHNESERRRRNQLKKLFFDLRDILPSFKKNVGKSKASRPQILKTGADYIKKLKQSFAEYRKKYENLHKENLRLQTELNRVKKLYLQKSKVSSFNSSSNIKSRRKSFGPSAVSRTKASTSSSSLSCSELINHSSQLNVTKSNIKSSSCIYSGRIGSIPSGLRNTESVNFSSSSSSTETVNFSSGSSSTGAINFSSGSNSTGTVNFSSGSSSIRGVNLSSGSNSTGTVNFSPVKNSTVKNSTEAVNFYSDSVIASGSSNTGTVNFSSGSSSTGAIYFSSGSDSTGTVNFSSGSSSTRGVNLSSGSSLTGTDNFSSRSNSTGVVNISSGSSKIGTVNFCPVKNSTEAVNFYSGSAIASGSSNTESVNFSSGSSSAGTFNDSSINSSGQLNGSSCTSFINDKEEFNFFLSSFNMANDPSYSDTARIDSGDSSLNNVMKFDDETCVVPSELGNEHMDFESLEQMLDFPDLSSEIDNDSHLNSLGIFNLFPSSNSNVKLGSNTCLNSLNSDDDSIDSSELEIMNGFSGYARIPIKEDSIPISCLELLDSNGSDFC